MIVQSPPQKSFSGNILGWYDAHARALPWRSPPGKQPDPYHIWLSEIMLQQTTVATVGPYFIKFLHAWPTVRQMAAAPLDDILTAWAGLGYYARARNLHKCAVAVSEEFGGEFPDDLASLRSLPGIGPYTAAAIAAIAFDMPETVVDGNIERVVSRLYRIGKPLPGAKKEITERAAMLTPGKRPGDYAQALMDIGAGICTPRNPDCGNCPASQFCAAFAFGDMEAYPVKAPRKVKPTRRAVVFWLQCADGRVLLRRRAETGLLGGMMEFPSTDWQEDAVGIEAAAADFFGGCSPEILSELSATDIVRHTFTHFHLELQPAVARIGTPGQLELADALWVHPDDFSGYALPTLMTKVARSVMGR